MNPTPNEGPSLLPQVAALAGPAPNRAHRLFLLPGLASLQHSPAPLINPNDEGKSEAVLDHLVPLQPTSLHAFLLGQYEAGSDPGARRRVLDAGHPAAQAMQTRIAKHPARVDLVVEAAEVGLAR